MRSSTYKRSIYTLFFSCSLIFTLPGSINAAIFGQQIFELQRKQAAKGNTLAQFKLGTFYEFGISVEKNSDIAKVWYIKASRKKYKPAINRLTYLDIKENGYDEGEHAQWFSRISEQAQQGKANSLIILAQMYHNGIVVKKDLSKALNLMKKASLKNRAEVDAEILEIQAKINTAKKRNIKKSTSDITSKKTPEKAKKKLTKPVTKKTSAPFVSQKKMPVKNKIKKNTVEKNKQAEKEKRYKEAMWKLHQENMQLQQTQQWAEDDEDEDLQ